MKRDVQCSLSGLRGRIKNLELEAFMGLQSDICEDFYLVMPRSTIALYVALQTTRHDSDDTPLFRRTYIHPSHTFAKPFF